MSIRIEDGLGTGKLANVDSNNRLKTQAVVTSHLADSSHHGRSFMVYAKHNTVVPNTDEQLCLITNTSTDRHIHIAQIIVTTDGYMSRFEAFFDSELVSGGTTITPLNLNRSSGLVTVAGVVDNRSDDLILSTDDTKEFITLRMSILGSSSYTFDFQGAIVLGKGNSISISASGVNVGDAGRAMIHYYEEDI